MHVHHVFDRSSRWCVTFAVLAIVATLTVPAGAQPFTSVAVPDIAAHVAFSTGVSWVDFDQDGDLDLCVVTGFSANNHNVLYRNTGGTFVRVLGVPMVEDGAESVCSTWADYDNDGDLDSFVSNLVNAGGMLYEGHGGAALTLNTTAGIGGSGLKGTGAVWGDYDNDGYVDLVIAALFGQGGITTPNRLFHNDGDGTFTEVTTGPPVATFDSAHHPTWSDYDGDGDLDLFFACGGPGFTKRDQLYRNELQETGTATFVPIGGVIATDFRDSQVLSWVDYDNDGDLDMYAVNYTSVPNQLYRNDGGTFTKLVTPGIATDMGAAHGVVWADFDNDGDQDCYVARDLSQSNRYYRNDGGGAFTTITTGIFVNEARSNYGAAAGDYDQDGDLDLFLPTARSEGPSMLLRNDLAPGSHWLVVRLQGSMSNRAAIGAKVRVKSTIGGTPRWQLREVLAGTSYGGHNALEAHFGLADAGFADSVRVEWPSGIDQVLTNVASDQRLQVVEDTTTPVAASVLEATASEDRVQVVWSIQADGHDRIAVQRSQDGVVWQDIGTVEVESRRRASFEDVAVKPGERWGYRLRLETDSGPVVMGETWIEVPAHTGFGIARVWPNPSRGDATQVQFDLRSGASAALAVYDAAGRLVVDQPIGDARAGRSVRRVEGIESLRSGVYWLRLREGSRVSSTRLVIAR